MSILISAQNAGGFLTAYVPHYFFNPNAESLYIGKKIGSNSTPTWNKVYKVAYYNGGLQTVYTTAIYINIGTTQGNLNLKSIYDQLVPGGFYPEFAIFTITDGGDSLKTIGSTSTSTAAINTGSDWPAWTTVRLIINRNCNVLGKGGNGGTGTGAGGSGGPAISLGSNNVYIYNYGIIAGGSGGGGGGTGQGYNAGGGGGGGLDGGAGATGSNTSTGQANGGSGGIDSNRNPVGGAGGCVYVSSSYYLAGGVCVPSYYKQWHPGWCYYYTCGWWYFRYTCGSCTREYYTTEVGPTYCFPIIYGYRNTTDCGGTGGNRAADGGAGTDGAGGAHGPAIKHNNYGVNIQNLAVYQNGSPISVGGSYGGQWA